MSHRISVMVHTPAHSGIGGALTYLSESPLEAGTLVRVPLGARDTLGVVWEDADTPQDLPAHSLKPIASVLGGVAALPKAWRQLVSFAASY